MKPLAIFPNAGEAAFAQSLLENAGITSALHDGGADICGVQSARISVANADFARASEIVTIHRSSIGQESELKKDEHPNAKFPFLGIMGLTSIVWCVLWLVYVLLKMPHSELMKNGIFQAAMGLLAIISGSLLWGLAIGFGVALFCLIATTTWRRLRNN
ncbi:MAG: DUF2007 domain-containing protein [Opitutaceae bacterium]